MAAKEYLLKLREGMGVEEGGRIVEVTGVKIYLFYVTPQYPPLPAAPSRNAQRHPTALKTCTPRTHRPQLRPTASIPPRPNFQKLFGSL
ncbi:hypothetical protein VNI00_019221, partial [Paramarasmius palmivorus]